MHKTADFLVVCTKLLHLTLVQCVTAGGKGVGCVGCDGHELRGDNVCCDKVSPFVGG